MSYKPSLKNFYQIRDEKLKEGKDTVLLGRKEGRLYRVKEYIGQLGIYL